MESKLPDEFISRRKRGEELLRRSRFGGAPLQMLLCLLFGVSSVLVGLLTHLDPLTISGFGVCLVLFRVVPFACEESRRRINDDWLRLMPDLASDAGYLLQLQESLTLPDEVWRTLSQPLARALSEIGPDSLNTIAPDQHRSLQRIISESNIDLAAAALSAFEHIGNEHDLAAVKRVASGTTLSGMPIRSERIVQRAKEVLPGMEVRLNLAHAGATLVRASAAPDADSLLRAEGVPTDDAPQTLMRPAERT